jgi:hypothetical protein
MQDRTDRPASMTQQEQSGLWQLRSRWLGIYHVALIDGVWRAKRYHDVTKVLTADSAGELGELIGQDYASAMLP